jgi:tetratricopeptide (TPR) repeat protein
LRQGRLQACLPVLEKGATAADEAGDRATLAHAYYLLDWALTDLGHPDAHRYRSLALPIYEELDDFGGQARVLNNLGIDAYYEGRWNEAVDYYEQSRRASERVGDVVEVATAENNIAEIRCDQGRYEEAEKLLQEALATWRAAGFRVGIGLAWSNLGRVAYRRGNLEPAAEFLGRAKTQFEHIGAAAFILEVEAREAERLLLAGDHVAALPLLGSIRERAQTLGAHPTLMSMLQRFAGYAKLQSGDVDSARIRFTEALDLAGSVGAGFEIALAQEALGGCGGPDAERLRAAAAQAFERLGVDDGVTPALQQLEPAGG